MGLGVRGNRHRARQLAGTSAAAMPPESHRASPAAFANVCPGAGCCARRPWARRYASAQGMRLRNHEPPSLFRAHIRQFHGRCKPNRGRSAGVATARRIVLMLEPCPRAPLAGRATTPFNRGDCRSSALQRWQEIRRACEPLRASCRVLARRRRILTSRAGGRPDIRPYSRVNRETPS